MEYSRFYAAHVLLDGPLRRLSRFPALLKPANLITLALSLGGSTLISPATQRIDALRSSARRVEALSELGSPKPKEIDATRQTVGGNARARAR